MRYEVFTDIGGFLWWTIIKFCKTDLKKERSKEKWSRNLFFLIILGYLIAFISIKIL